MGEEIEGHGLYLPAMPSAMPSANTSLPAWIRPKAPNNQLFGLLYAKVCHAKRGYSPMWQGSSRFLASLRFRTASKKKHVSSRRNGTLLVQWKNKNEHWKSLCKATRRTSRIFYKDHLHNLFTAQIASSLNSGIKHTTGLEEVGRQQWHLVTTSGNDYTYLNPSLPCWEYYPNITSCPVFISMWALGFDSWCWIDSPVQRW